MTTDFKFPTCKWCEGKQDCPAEDEGYMCTNDEGHKGRHTACGTDKEWWDHPIHEWTNDGQD